jgi:sugar phosphate isomerase/epimerase
MLKYAVSSYSFHRFGSGPEGNDRPSFDRMIERCAELGFDGLELLGVHFEKTDLDELRRLKQFAFQRGVDLIAVSAHHNFVTPDPEKRMQEVEKLCRWADVAYELGAPAVRAFGGRWATRPNFAEFMAANGEEPPLEGYTEDDGYDWSIEAFKIASYYAGKKGVTIALENHWGFTHTAEGVYRILDAVRSPWLKVVLDIGNFNFCADPYAEMVALAPQAIMVHAKTYTGGGIYYTADLDYRSVGRILKDAGFSGYASLEFEGKAHPDQAIPEGLRLLKEAFEDD